MKIFISADMEGATGITSPRQVDCCCPEYVFGCKMQLHDVQAAILGALDGGADEVIVNDAHNHMTNLDFSGPDWPVKARLTSGSPKMLGMMDGFDECDGVFFLCYHAMAGTQHAVLDHTIDPNVAYSIRVNGREFGEIGINAAATAARNVPVALVTGDDATCREAQRFLGTNAVTACVKQARGALAATSLSPQESFETIRKAACEAAKRIASGTAPVFSSASNRANWTAEIVFHLTKHCDAAAVLPFVTRTGGRSVTFTAPDAVILRRQISAVLDLAGTA